MRQTIVERFALDEEVYMHRRGGAEHERVKLGVTNRTSRREKKREKSAGWARIKRV